MSMHITLTEKSKPLNGITLAKAQAVELGKQ